YPDLLSVSPGGSSPSAHGQKLILTGWFCCRVLHRSFSDAHHPSNKCAAQKLKESFPAPSSYPVDHSVPSDSGSLPVAEDFYSDYPNLQVLLGSFGSAGHSQHPRYSGLITAHPL